jgi:23S rRNA pseudouridine955/2504/2580 synthase
MSEVEHNRVQEVEIGASHSGQRIDNYLLTRLKGVPRTRIYRILRKGEVRVNRGRVKPDYRLCKGDVVRIPPVRVAPPKGGAPSNGMVAAVSESIIYEDKKLLVLDKPAGIAVHGGSGVSFGVIEALRAARPDAPFLELAHRLDRDTSGCLVIAKRRSALRAFHTLLRDGGIEKRYLALVRGRWQGGARRVEAPLRKNTLKSGERVVRVDPAGKSALSIFEPVAIYGDSSLVQVNLITGRTHQVRVHAAHIGHPLAGDGKYGDQAFNRLMAARGLKRLFLHASSLSFTLALEGAAPVEISAPLSAELRRVLDELEGE